MTSPKPGLVDVSTARVALALKKVAEDMWKEAAREMHLKPPGELTAETRIAIAFESLADELEKGVADE